VLAIVWFVGSTSELPSNFMARLQSEFPVRLIESFESLERFHNEAKMKPDTVIGSGINGARDALRKSQILDFCLPGAKKIFLSLAGDSENTSLPALTWLLQNDCPDLCEQISSIVGGSLAQEGRFVLQYKNVLLNFEEFVLRILPNLESVEVPLKEARILKLFMSQPNVVLTRDHIREAVWGNIAISARTIDSYICRIRKYLVGGGVDIDSIYGGGYVLR
jgi:hypothetical protein